MKSIKNMKLAKKMYSAFIIVLVIFVAVSLLSIFSMKTLSENDERMYTYNTLPLSNLAVLYDTLAGTRICLSNGVIFKESDPEFSQSELSDLHNKEAEFEEALAGYSQQLSSDEEREIFARIEEGYNGGFAAAKEALLAAIDSGDNAMIAEGVKAVDSGGSDVSGIIDEAFASNTSQAEAQVNANKKLYENTRLILIIVDVVAAVVSMLLAYMLASIISKPINRIMDATKQAGEYGDFNFSGDVVAAIQEDASYKDEIGQTALAFATMMDALIAKTKVLDKVANGDLTAEVPMASSKDTIGRSLTKMIDNLNSMFSEINSATTQVSGGANQIANSAQSLAQGATEQAATVDNISASISAISEQSETSSNTAREAASGGAAIKDIALDGNVKMNSMMKAVQEINDASSSIEQVIKTIDDIAFQTNILALNAAVEAARAGQHGAGFAVVADEVRNLAAKSAEAAKETAALISTNIQKAELGLSIAKETAQSLEKIVEGIQRTSDSLELVTGQSDGVRVAASQVNGAVSQVVQVVQQNSAMSQESAAAGEEMSSQAQVLKNLVARFKLKE